MKTARLEAFSDGVMAIVITIMVLELKVPSGPEGAASAEWSGLRPLLPVLLSYVLSFVYLAIYWNNHHHMLQATERVNGAILWANMHLLFWLSLVPFVTGWMGQNHFAPQPAAAYGIVLLLTAVAYTILQNTIIASQGEQSTLHAAVGSDRKGKLSLALYAIAIALTFWNQWIAVAIYTAVAAIWLIPDRRIESRMNEQEQEATANERR